MCADPRREDSVLLWKDHNSQPPALRAKPQWRPCCPMAKPNYQYEKRQRELKKAAKQEEKRQQKRARNQPDGASGAPEDPPHEDHGS